MEPFLLIVVAIAILVLLLAAKGLIIVKQAEVVIVERLGKYHSTLTSGVNIIWPFLDRPRKINWRFVRTDVNGRTIVIQREVDRIDLRETVYDFPRQNVITKDNVGIEINALLYFQITDPIKSVYEISNLPDAIEKLTQTTLRNVIGELDLDQTLVSRDTINRKLRNILDEATDKWGVKINRVELQDITPPEDVRTAMEKQMKAERDKRAAILEAEGRKRAAILEAEGTREAAIRKAEGEKQSQILRAEGRAQAIERVANAEKSAIFRVAEAVKDSKADPTQYLISVKYIDALKEMVAGDKSKVVFMPFEASGVLGAVGAVRELLQERANETS